MSSATIYIQEGINNQAGAGNEYYAPQVANTPTKATMKSLGAVGLANASINAAKSMGRFALSNYGDFTGDYIGQEKINNTFAMINAGLSLVTATVSGAMMGGLPGALAGFAVGLINVGLDAAQNAISTNLTNSRLNGTASGNAQRMGRILLNGSR